MTTDDIADEPSTVTDGPRTSPPDPDDPVLERRERIKRLCDLGSRIGYGCFGLALVLFFTALMTGFPAPIVTVVVAAMAVGSVVLLPSIILGYGVKAADAEDRGEKFGY